MAVSHAPEARRTPWSLSECPACASVDLEPVVDTVLEEVNFRCANCGRHWHVELGYVHEVLQSRQPS